MQKASAAYGIYPTVVGAAEVVREFNNAGFSKDHICLILAPSHPIARIVRDANLLNADREASAATAGLIGWLSSFGAVVIPSVGLFIRSQAFVQSLLLTGDTSAFCGSSPMLAGLGFPEAEATRFEAHIQQEGFLVYIDSLEAERLPWALKLFHLTGAEESSALLEEVKLEEAKAEAVA